MITAVIFDMDDTLYPEVEYCKSGFSAAADYIAQNLTTLDPKTIYDSLWHQFTTADRTTIFNSTLEKLNIDYNKNTIATLVKTYRQHTPNITLPAPSRNVLETLKPDYTLALLTDGFLPAQKLKVHALGIVNYFKHIVYTEQLGREFWKPSTKGFEILLKNINTAPENAVYIADNPQKDFIAPNKLGMATIQLKTPYQIHDFQPQSPDSAPKQSINNINQLPQLIKKLNQH